MCCDVVCVIQIVRTTKCIQNRTEFNDKVNSSTLRKTRHQN